MPIAVFTRYKYGQERRKRIMFLLRFIVNLVIIMLLTITQKIYISGGIAMVTKKRANGRIVVENNDKQIQYYEICPKCQIKLKKDNKSWKCTMCNAEYPHLPNNYDEWLELKLK